MGRSLSAPTLADPLVSLRPWRRGDAEALELACGDQDICRFTTVPDRYTREDAEAWIARQHQRLAAGGAIVLAIVPADSENVVQPVTSSQMAQYEAYGPRLQVAMFDEGDPPPTTEVEEFADRARHVFFG